MDYNVKRLQGWRKTASALDGKAYRMTSAPGEWRVSAAYDYFDALDPEQIAFEFLRRDQDYAANYRELDDGDQDPTLTAPAAFSARWGLRFRSRSGAARGSSLCCLAAALQCALDLANARRRRADRRTHVARLHHGSDRRGG